MDMIRRKSFLRIFPNQVRLPQEVRLLLHREREIATIVYALHAATAEDVAQCLSEPLSNASVRSMLNRLVAKGILKRILSGQAFVYLAGLTCADSGMFALRRFADDHFGGSVASAAETMKGLLSRR